MTDLGPRSRHLEMDLEVDFAEMRVHGSVEHHLERPAHAGERLELDSRGLEIHGVEAASADSSFSARELESTKIDEHRGHRLRVGLGEGDAIVRVRYRSGANASGLQWLSPEQTTGGKLPYLFSQGQSIHTRSWLPCLDEPALRASYRARVHCPRELRAIMAAPRRTRVAQGVYEFEMPIAIPSYLIAMAVGNLAEAEIGPRCAVVAEPEQLEAARYEFAETESMLQSCEELFGPYRWERYDLLVLPPAAPLGGMENPTLTFITPTIIAGDRSLVSVVAHELAHSWSGNLVTNAGWGDFWLNEGFTVYLERRILEKVYGVKRAEIEACIGRDRLQRTLERFADRPEETRLAQPEPAGHPDHSIHEVPYEKGFLFLRQLELLHGRDAFDRFLRGWFDEHAFRSATSREFEDYLNAHLPPPQGFAQAEWLHGTGIPERTTEASSARLDELRAAARLAKQRELPPLDERESWSPLEWILYLRELDEPSSSLLSRLAKESGLDDSQNPEIQSLWLALGVRAGRKELFGKAREFVMQVGRHKLIAPVYDALLARKAKLAREIYAQARPRYHAMVHLWLDEKMGFSARA